MKLEQIIEDAMEDLGDQEEETIIKVVRAIGAAWEAGYMAGAVKGYGHGKQKGYDSGFGTGEMHGYAQGREDANPID